MFGEVKAMLAPTSQRPEEREFVVDSGASELSSVEMDTIIKARNPTIVLTGSGEVHTLKEAQVFNSRRNGPNRITTKAQ